MLKTLLKILISIILLDGLGATVILSPVLDSNCEELSYLNEWPETQYEGKNITLKGRKYIASGQISCDPENVTDCIAIIDDGEKSVYATYDDLRSRVTRLNQNEKKAFKILSELQLLSLLNKLHTKNQNSKLTSAEGARLRKTIADLITRNPRLEITSDYYTNGKLTDPANEMLMTAGIIESSGALTTQYQNKFLNLLTKVHAHPTASTFNWETILLGYKHVISLVNDGLVRKDENGELVLEPDFATKTRCANILKGQRISTANLNSCLQFQAYCTENLAMAGIKRDYQRSMQTFKWCSNVVQDVNHSSFDYCSKRLNPTESNSVFKAIQLINGYNELFILAQTNMPEYTREFFNMVHGEYSSFANDLEALLPVIQNEANRIQISEVNTREASQMFGACTEELIARDPNASNFYTQISKSYLEAFSDQENNSNTNISESNLDYSNSKRELKNACIGITQTAIDMTESSIRKHEEVFSKITEEDDKEVLEVLNEVISQINLLCATYSTSWHLDREKARALVDADRNRYNNERKQPSSSSYVQTFNPSQSTQAVEPRIKTYEEAYSELDRIYSADSSKQELLKKAEELFIHLIYAQALQNGESVPIANPVPTFMQSETFRKLLNIDEIAEVGFKSACINTGRTMLLSSPNNSNSPEIKSKEIALTGHFIGNGIVKRTFTQRPAFNRTDLIKARAELIAGQRKVNQDAKNDQVICNEDRNIQIQSNNRNVAYYQVITAESKRTEIINKYIVASPAIVTTYLNTVPNSVSPIFCLLLKNGYKDDNFKKWLKVGVDVASLVAMFATFGQASWIIVPARIGLIAVSLTSAGIRTKDIVDNNTLSRLYKQSSSAGHINTFYAMERIDDLRQRNMDNYIRIVFDTLLVVSAGVELMTLSKQTVTSISKTANRTQSNTNNFNRISDDLVEGPGSMFGEMGINPGGGSITSTGGQSFTIVVEAPTAITKPNTYIMTAKDLARIPGNSNSITQQLSKSLSRIAPQQAPSYINAVKTQSTINSIPASVTQYTNGILSSASIVKFNGASAVQIVNSIPTANGMINQTNYYVSEANGGISRYANIEDPLGNKTLIDEETATMLDDMMENMNKFCR